MTKRERILVGAMLVAFFSQLYLDLLIDNFRVSCGVIALGIFIYTNKDISGRTIGIASAISTLLWRLLVLVLFEGFDAGLVIGYIPEIFFYVGYGFFMQNTVQKHALYSFELFFIFSVVCDYTMNLLEILIRVTWFKQFFFQDILTTLLFVAVIRAAIILVILMVLRYQKILLLKEEHEDRYKRLLWLNAFLRTEIFWMESNMDRIEQVMTRAYTHFEDIRDHRNEENWSADAVNIAGAVHEIKKEYELVIRGVNDLMENKYQNQSMTFQSILTILEEQMRAEAQKRDVKVNMHIQGGADFHTEKHFQIMSVFRNLITNALDAAESSDHPVTIKLSHWTEGSVHRFQISDNGPGIEADNIALIQTPGFSTKINYQTGHINRGLGLTIVYRYVEDLFGGTIDVQSMPNRQTLFDIKIPKNRIEVQK